MPSKTKRGGFTLIELLTVVAIIGILATLSLTGIGKARVAADAVVCMNNLRQIGTALQLYLGEKGEYPLQTEPGDPDATHHWPEYLDAHTGASWPSDGEFEDGVFVGPNSPAACDRSNLFVCPEYRRLRGWFVGPSHHSVDAAVFGAYAYNASGTGGNGLGGFGIGRGLLVPRRHAPVREAMVVNPSDMYTFGDASLFHTSPDGKSVWGNAYDFGFNVSYHWNGGKGHNTFIMSALARRHAGRFLIAFADGHAEKIKREDLLDLKNPDRLRRFSRDNLPHTQNLWW